MLAGNWGAAITATIFGVTPLKKVLSSCQINNCSRNDKVSFKGSFNLLEYF